MVDAVLTKETDRAADLGQADPAEVMAYVGKCGIGVPFHTQHEYFVPLFTQSFGNDDWVSTPASQDAHFARAGW
jgi:hypothetical protein